MRKLSQINLEEAIKVVEILQPQFRDKVMYWYFENNVGGKTLKSRSTGIEVDFDFFGECLQKTDDIEVYDREFSTHSPIGVPFSKLVEAHKYLCRVNIHMNFNGAALNFDAEPEASDEEPTHLDESEAGYHLRKIQKGEIGKASKIQEECEEFLDAIEQGSSVLAMVELGDLIGAIEAFAENHNLTLEDLIKYSEINKRAFKNGRRC